MLDIFKSCSLSLRVAIRIHIALVVYRLLYREDLDACLSRLGTDYGGWWIPDSFLHEASVCYTAGVGTDISFDLALIEKYGCSVWGIDPTPRSIDYVRKLQPEQRFKLITVGVSAATGTARFYSPRDPTHVSHSLKNLGGSTTFFEAEVQTISDIMADLQHDHIDLLKLDVEGAEHDTVRKMLADGILPGVICIEFDQPEGFRLGRTTTRMLRASGYKLVKLDGLNLTFVRE